MLCVRFDFQWLEVKLNGKSDFGFFQGVPGGFKGLLSGYFITTYMAKLSQLCLHQFPGYSMDVDSRFQEI
jgi:hypothetical protein